MASSAKTSNGGATAAAKAATGAEPSFDDVTDQLATLRGDMARLVETVAALGRATSDDAAGTVASTAQDLREKGRESLAAVRERGETVVGDIAGFLHRRPTEAMAVAAGLGFIVGLLARRR